ncbi:MAG: MBOAT family protein [Candidatus Omnitrophica bacterium]|nr:MBOAT family protein [Candidatus Omnitrophota bacterium]
MLFNSYIFIFLYLPITFAGFFWLGRRGQFRTAIIWLTAASLFFYAWWNPRFVFLISVSILFNYAVGVRLSRPSTRSRGLLIFGVAMNLVVLGYFKYANFFVASLNAAFGLSWHLSSILLPLGISFFTFTQIAYLVDAHKGIAKEYSLWHYGLFVTFFPHLVAGPILHHKDLIPQFSKPSIYRPDTGNFAAGSALFFIGLFKKVIFADSAARYAIPVFNAAAAGVPITFFEAWSGALAYTFQLYFDFSGYSDMAVGLGLLMGIALPLNFNSPYQSENVIEFWKRWHMTLSHFLRDYLYIPLGGNRKGSARRYLNLMLTMLLGGLWHGAGRSLLSGRNAAGVVNFDERQFQRLIIANRSVVPENYGIFLEKWGVSLSAWGVRYENSVLWPGLGGLLFLLGLWVVCWLFPNSQEVMRYSGSCLFSDDSVKRRWRWTPSWSWSFGLGLMAALGIAGISQVSEFLYFQF